MSYRERANISLADLRRFVEEGRWDKKGVRCPVCDRLCKVYPRHLNSGMARTLIWVVKQYLGGQEWVNVARGPTYVLQNREYGRFAHWGFIIQSSNDDPAKRTSGLWRPTRTGIAFARNRKRVPKTAHLYHNEVLLWSAETVNIVDALGKRWDYRELWDA
jgi:hypothetical protein